MNWWIVSAEKNENELDDGIYMSTSGRQRIHPGAANDVQNSNA
jgi:hypothetical protein